MHLLLANISLLQFIDRGTDIEDYVGIQVEIMVLVPTVYFNSHKQYHFQLWDLDHCLQGTQVTVHVKHDILKSHFS